MLELHPQVVVSNRQDRQSLIVDLVVSASLLASLVFPHEGAQKLILKQDYREHRVLQGVLVAVELAEHRAEVQMGVCQSFGLVLLEL